jgi:hypothetical protein
LIYFYKLKWKINELCDSSDRKQAYFSLWIIFTVNKYTIWEWE